MMIKVNKGLAIPLAGEPDQTVGAVPPIHSVALVASDYLGLKPELRVAEGDYVRLGQPVFEDRDNQGVKFTAPAAGIISAIQHGAKRRLQSVVISCQGDDEVIFDAWSRHTLPALEAPTVRQHLLDSGLWTALRSRPFGRVPQATAQPQAIFVTAIDTNPLAPHPNALITAQLDDFADGIQVLGKLTTGVLYVCTSPHCGWALPHIERMQAVQVAGPHPAGLVGTHIHFLEPLEGDKCVWYINYQDVIAIGRLFTTGRIQQTRTISLAGPLVRTPRLIEAPLGASIDDLVADELMAGASRVISGSVLSGRRALGAEAYLGRYHLQISALSETHQRQFLGWLAPGRDKFSASRMFLSSLLRKHGFNLTTAQNGSPRAMVPIGSYEKVMPLDIFITPLLKALLVGDSESAKMLGCLELEEEDLALCSFVCCSKYNFGAALRDVLTMIEKTG